MKRKAFVLCAVLCCAGCAAPVTREVFNERGSGNVKQFSASAKDLHKATLLAMCSKNFIIEKDESENGFLLGKRSFQRGKKTIVLLLQAKATSIDKEDSVLHLNALQTTERYYIADRTRFFLWIVPLPGGGGREVSNVKEAEETVQDKQFYTKFFKEVEVQLKNIASKESVVSEPPEALRDTPEELPQENEITKGKEDENNENL